MEMNLSAMARLRPWSVRYIVVHTADYGGPNCDAEMINGWHIRERRWPGIGYHFVILNDKHQDWPDGTVQTGRPLDRCGAHVKGLNSVSVGICCVGQGDLRPFTEPQMTSLAGLVAQLMERFEVPLDRVIGHRDVNRLIDEGLLPERDAQGRTNRTGKSCPGLRVDMQVIRDRVARHIASAAAEPVLEIPAIVPRVVPRTPEPPAPPPGR